MRISCIVRLDNLKNYRRWSNNKRFDFFVWIVHTHLFGYPFDRLIYKANEVHATCFVSTYFHFLLCVLKIVQNIQDCHFITNRLIFEALPFVKFVESCLLSSFLVFSSITYPFLSSSIVLFFNIFSYLFSSSSRNVIGFLFRWSRKKILTISNTKFKI